MGQPVLISAQPHQDLADKTYKEGVLRKVADLAESECALADQAKGYSDEFQLKGASGAYKEFAR